MPKVAYTCLVVVVLLPGIVPWMWNTASVNSSVEMELTMMRKGNLSFYDPVHITPHQVCYPPLQVKDPEYTIPWGTPWFRCFFKEEEAALKVEVKKAWISYAFVDQDFGVTKPVRAKIHRRSVEFSEVFSGIDVRYTVEQDHVLEEVIIYTPCAVTEIVQKIAFEGVTPVEKDKGIYFWNGEKFLFGIPAPVMYELGDKDVKCTGLHYELEFCNGEYYLRKVIDEEGLKWLVDADRVYPVVLDATTQSFEDPWENAGLQPYGQYFQNLSEYVNPTTGQLTVKQTDFFLPGKGLDVDITRVYTVPAVFSTGCKGVCAEGSVTLPNYEDAPYHTELECPPVDIGNGWQLNFPWVGAEYIHYLDGTMYKRQSANHVGHHFTFEDGVLTMNSGIEYYFTNGVVTSATDTDGNTISFGYTGGRLTTITDTVGRVINLSYNNKGQLTQISYGSYTVTYSYSLEALASVTDHLGRITSYEYDQRNNWLLTRISYPAGGHTDYTYSQFSQQAEPPDPFGCFELRKYHVTDQAVYSPSLVRRTCYTYQGDFDGINVTMKSLINSENVIKAVHEFGISNELVTQHVVKNASGAQLRKVEYTYSDRKEMVQKNVYMGTSYAYTQNYVYDSWGNIIYEENGEGEKAFYCYANTDSEKVFRDCNGSIPEFSNQFFDNTVLSHIHTRLLGSVSTQDDRVFETYYNYDSAGHLIETRQVFQLEPDYSVFSDVFDENGQTSFPVDLNGVQLQGDAVLKITGIPNPNEVTKTETHSKYKYCTWLNEGYWQGNKFYAKCVSKGWPPEQGHEPIGPFFHYPGTSGYKNYTTWVTGYNQYVKTTYTELEDRYCEQVEYNLNGGVFNVITSNLGEKTVYYSIPVEELLSGLNMLNFRESSSWVTKCEWALYVPHAVIPIEEVSTEFTYNAHGNLTSATDALGNTTSFGYDAQYHAYLTCITNALNNTVTADYDFLRGFLTSITDAKGNTTSFQYDTLGRVTKKINPDLTETEAVYNDQNNTVTIYDELDNKTVQYYDGINRLTKSEWYLSDTVILTETYTYNYLNKIKTVTDAGGQTYMYEYDPVGRLRKQFNPDLTFKQIQYDDTLNTVFVFDENQHKKEYNYDWAGRLMWVKEYTDSETYYLTQYTYDSAGHLTSVTDANGNTTLYRYDSMVGVTQITYPDATTEAFSYDALGNVIQRADAHGTTAFMYNAIYQLTGIQYPDQSSIAFEYDSNGNRTLMTDSEGQTSYVYDIKNRLTSETRTIDGDAYTVSYTYDAVSNLLSMTYPDESVVTFEHDSLNRLTTIPGYAEFTYNAKSLLSSMTYSNGVVTTYQYDINDRPVIIHSVRDGFNLLLMNYQYDPANNITQLDYSRKQGQQWVQSSETFHYDHLDRLISAEGDYGLQSYSYDPVGNRLSVNDLNYTYNDMNELLSISGTTFIYDENGNTLSKTDSTDTWSYTYDTRNLLTQVEKNQQLISQYTYDGDGRRIKKTEWVDSLQEYQTTIYVYSGLNVIYEKNINTNQEATYVYGPTGRIAKNVDELRDYYHTDHLGSTRLTTDENGNILTETEYQPFGYTNGETSLYTGKEKDSTGLYYYGVRYYDPEIGRFTTRDPLQGKMESPQTQNRYTYCLNNPLKYVDPRGLDILFVILPDGTISYEMAELYNKMKKGLDSMTEEDWKQIEKYLASTDPATKMEAIKMILRKAGIEFQGPEVGDWVSITLGEIMFTIQFGHLPVGKWGTIEKGGNPFRQTILIADWISKGGDLFLVLGHELAHAFMISYHKDTIKSIEQQFGKEGRIVYMEFISYQWQFSVLNQVPNVSLMQRETIKDQFRIHSLLWYIIENNPMQVIK